MQGSFRVECLGCYVVECKYCKTWLPDTLWTTDHVIPQAHGGPYRAIANLVIACGDCNQKKGGHVPCQVCGSVRKHKTRDRITWTETAYCAGCGTLAHCTTRPRPVGAPPHLRYGRHYRATGRIVAMRGYI